MFCRGLLQTVQPVQPALPPVQTSLKLKLQKQAGSTSVLALGNCMCIFVLVKSVIKRIFI